MAERHAKTSHRTSPSRASFLLVVLFVLQAAVPLASSEGAQFDDMALCSGSTAWALGGICDDRLNADDGTVGISSWVEGMYNFNMTSPTQIQFQASWAIREWDKSPFGFDALETILQNQANIGTNDGLPADVLRASFDNNTDPNDPGSPTVQEQLLSEVNGSVNGFLGSWGSSSTPQTDWSDRIFLPDDTGVRSAVDCTTDVNENQDGNSFSPPICITTSVNITLGISSTYGLSGVNEANLNSAFEAMLIMGAEVTTQFSVNVEAGFKGTYAIEPPAFATVVNAGGTGGSLESNSVGTPYNSGVWSVDNRNPQGSSDSPLPGNLLMTMGFREINGTNKVSIDSDARSLDLKVVLDLADESSASIEVIAGIYQIQSSTLEQWGVSPLMSKDKATIPVITSDGIRMAYDTGLLDLSELADKVPISGIADAISASNDDLSVSMGTFQWTSVAQGSLSPGGLNYSHSSPCTSGVNYCTAGSIAMDDSFPVYMRSISHTFPLSLADLLGGNLGDGAGFMNSVTGDDLGILLDSGVEFSTVLSDETMETFIGGMLPSGLSADLTLEIVLPTWAKTKDGSSTITLSYRVSGNHDGEISLGGSNMFDWEHALCLNSTGDSCTDMSGDAFCTSTMRTCVRSDVALDLGKVSVASLPLTKGVTVEFEFMASMEIHRIGLPDSIMDSLNSESTSVELAVLPSDLLRLLLEIGSRGDPISHDFSMCEGQRYCQQTITFSNSEQGGLSSFATNFGEALTSFIRDEARSLSSSNDSGFGEMDLDGLRIVASIPQDSLIDHDSAVGDSTGIVLSVHIPRVSMTVGVDNSWFELFSIITEGGEPRVGVGTRDVANTMVAPFLGPMMGAMEGLTGALSASLVDLQGIRLPSEANIPMPQELSDTMGPEDLGFRLTGELEMTMPRGLFLRNLTSKLGMVSEDVNEETGQQVITYMLSPNSNQDVLTFNVELSWAWIIEQMLVYIGAVLILFMWRIRRRSVKKKRIRRTAELEKLSQAAEGSAGVYVPPQPTVEVLKVAENGIVIKRRLSPG